MKTNEFTTIDEGVWDYLKRAGIAGEKAQVAAMAAYDQQKTQAAGFAAWATKLQQAFYGALNANAISLTENHTKNIENVNYKKFDLILESIITEQTQDIVSWMKNYVKAFMTNYVLPTNYDATITSLINQFKTTLKQEYAKNPKKQYNFQDAPNGPVAKIFNYIYSIGQQQQRDARGNIQSYERRNSTAGAAGTAGAGGAGGAAGTGAAGATGAGGTAGAAGTGARTAATGTVGAAGAGTTGATGATGAAGARTGTPAVATGARVGAGTEIELPGTNLKFRYSPQWITADGKIASDSSAKVLNQIASGVNRADISMRDLTDARRQPYKTGPGMSQYSENKKNLKNMISKTKARKL
jgi:hypothetical protein